MHKIKIVFLIIFYDLKFLSCALPFTNSFEKFTKVEKSENIYVGKNLYQKIKMFHINDSKLICTERFLPILFLMLNEKNSETEVAGLLTENGNLIESQETIKCRIFKK